MTKLINIHTHKNTVEPDMLKLGIVDFVRNQQAEHFNYYTAGIHPWDIETILYSKFEQKIITHLSNKNCLGLGEIGLDKTIQSSLAQQEEVLVSQLKLAQQMKTQFLVIHNVKATDELYRILNSFKNKWCLLLHDFRGNRAIFDQFSKIADVYLSLGTQFFVGQNSSQKLLDLPSHKIFFETDDKELNEVEHIQALYHKYSKLLQKSELEIQILMANNFDQLKKTIL